MLYIINILLLTLKRTEVKHDYFGYYVSYKGSNGQELKRGCFYDWYEAVWFSLTKMR